VGIDRWEGERALLDALVAECPSHMAVTQVDLGYSTSHRNGGLYRSNYGGALKTILSYVANSRHVAYLDDDNWYATDHLATLLAAVQGKDWAFALRNFIDSRSGDFLCPDTWESVGPDCGVYAKAQGGFVDTNCYVIDTQKCADVFPEWAMTPFAGGTGGDRQILARLRHRPWGATGTHTVNYRQNLAGQHPFIKPLEGPISVRTLVDRLARAATIVGDPARQVDGVVALLPGHPRTLTFCDAADAQRRLDLSAASVVAVAAPLQATPEQTLTMLGIGAVVIDNVGLEPGVIVGGGGVVTRAAKAGEKLVGVPARHAPALRTFGPTPREP
jgi:hypothetical protein